MPEKDASLDIVTDKVSFVPVEFELAFLGKRSSWRPVGIEGHVSKWDVLTDTGVTYYSGAFRQGAIIYPQNLFVVDTFGPVQQTHGKVRAVTDSKATAAAKLLRDVNVDHIVNSENLYCTAASQHILPFTTDDPLWTVVLPTLVNPEDPEFRPVSVDDLLRAGRIETAGWFDWAEAQWISARRDGESSKLSQRLDYMGQFRAQAGRQPFVVIYTSSGSRPFACLVDDHRSPLPFVARDQTYWAAFTNIDEAYYVMAFLNSNYAAGAILDWMTKGLFGPRHVHKKVLDVPWPVFDQSKESHNELVHISMSLAVSARVIRESLTDKSLGIRRRKLREQLSSDLLDRLEILVASNSSPNIRTH